MKTYRFVIKVVFYFMIFISLQKSFSQTFPVDTLINNGNLNTHINFVFLSDGYKNSEMNKFITDVNTIVDKLFLASPFLEYKSFFNVYAIKVPSIESGAIHPRNANDESSYNVPVSTPDNYFGSTFDYAGIHRLLFPTNSTAINNVLADNFPSYDQIFVLVNSPYYGGSGGSYATASSEANSAEVAIHEIGHSFANLADEYGGSGGNSREAANTTKETIRQNIRWNIWIESSTPVPTPPNSPYLNVMGLFEGAAYQNTGWYRPKYECKMRSLNTDFCEVCREEFILSMYNKISSIEFSYPSDNSLSVTSNNDLLFYINSIKPDPNTLVSEWYLNNQLLSTQKDSIIIKTSQLSNGSNKLSVVVSDTTTFVRKTLTPTSLELTLNYNSASVTKSGLLSDNFLQIYPNPTTDYMNFKIVLSKPSQVKLILFSMDGKKLQTLFKQKLAQGTFIYKFDLNEVNIPDGIFIAKLEIDSEIVSNKVITIAR